MAVVFWKYSSAIEHFHACSSEIKKCAMSVIIRVWALSGAILIKADIVSYVDRREILKSSCCVRLVEKKEVVELTMSVARTDNVVTRS
jgi:hypothetical protein